MILQRQPTVGEVFYGHMRRHEVQLCIL